MRECIKKRKGTKVFLHLAFLTISNFLSGDFSPLTSDACEKYSQ